MANLSEDKFAVPCERQSVMVVDDVKLYREILRRWLIENACSCQTAEGGNEAWAIFKRDVPDLVITDIDMTAGNGFELISRIRQNDSVRNRHTKIVVMSSLKDDQIEGFTQRVGADAFIEKPLAKSATVRLIESLLGPASSGSGAELLVSGEHESGAHEGLDTAGGRDNVRGDGDSTVSAGPSRSFVRANAASLPLASLPLEPLTTEEPPVAKISPTLRRIFHASGNKHATDESHLDG